MGGMASAPPTQWVLCPPVQDSGPRAQGGELPPLGPNPPFREGSQGLDSGPTTRKLSHGLSHLLQSVVTSESLDF